MIPDITFQLAKENKDMALFSPYDIKRAYGKDMSDISITEEYDKLLANPAIKKTYISARKFFQLIAELHFESGYPYLLFDDTVNKRNPHAKKAESSCLTCVLKSLKSAPQALSKKIWVLKPLERISAVI